MVSSKSKKTALYNYPMSRSSLAYRPIKCFLIELKAWEAIKESFA